MTNAIFNPNTERSRFDYATMQQEWADFLSLDGGMGYMEPKVRSVYVAAFTQAHHAAFTMALDELSVRWDDLEGEFAAEQIICWAYESGFPVDREELDMIWSNCFDYTQGQFDVIEAVVTEQLDLGII